MAKVRSETVWIGGKEFHREIRCDRDGLFTANLPDYVVEVLGGRREMGGPTLEACKSAWEAAVKEYLLSRTTRRRVIVYHVRMCARIQRSGRAVLARSEMGLSEGMALELAVGVYDEIAVAAPRTGVVKYRYEFLDSSIPTAFRITRNALNVPHGDRAPGCVEWTPEAEAWFAALCGGYEALLLKLDRAFASPAQLTAVMAGDVPLLLAPPGREDVDRLPE